MKVLAGRPVADAITQACREKIAALSRGGVLPKLAMIRIGARGEDIAYERGMIRRFSSAGAAADVHELSEANSRQALERLITKLNGDPMVHGILVLRPLPESIDEQRIAQLIRPDKDIDCMSDTNAAALFKGLCSGYPPCTPAAVMELLRYYRIDPAGRKATIVGRSMVVGKPLAVMLTALDATVTLCHTGTRNLPAECRNADILISCAGKPHLIGADATRPGQVIIDVGINMDEGRICGDVDYASVKDIVEAISPVPGGVGSITTSILLEHTVRSAANSL